MKTFLIGCLSLLLALILCVSLALSQEQLARMSLGVIGGGAGSAAPPAPTYLLSEDFDSTTLCATGYTENCTNTWTVTAGAPNYQGTGLAGTYAVALSGKTDAADERMRKSVTSTAEVWGYFLMMCTDAGTSNTTLPISWLRAGTSAVGNYSITVISSTYVLTVKAEGGTVASTVGTLSLDTLYHVWIYYKAGTGADGIATIAFSTDGTKPTSGNYYAISNDGTTTTNVTNVDLAGDYTSATVGFDMVYDKVRVDDVAIGSNPS